MATITGAISIYSFLRKVMAPSWIMSEISIMASLPGGSFLIEK